MRNALLADYNLVVCIFGPKIAIQICYYYYYYYYYYYNY